MKTYRATSGPFAEAILYENKDIERICEDELRESNLFPSKPEPIRIDRFVEKRFGIHPEYIDMAEGVLGYTSFGPSGAEAMYLSKSLSEDTSVHASRRMNSTLAHEAGHILLHTPLFVLPPADARGLFDHPDFSKTKILCREEYKIRRPWWEIQANKCIPALLLPESLVAQAVVPFLSQLGSFGKATIADDVREAAARELASIFEVNPQVVGYRLDALYPRTGGQLTL